MAGVLLASGFVVLTSVTLYVFFNGGADCINGKVVTDMRLKQ